MFDQPHPALFDKTAWVTGASRGLGAGLARALHRQGVRLFLTSLTGPRAVAEELQARWAVCDVTSEQQVEEAARQCGPVDFLINNAGVEHGDPMGVNATGAFLCCRAARAPRIVNIGSDVSLIGGRGMAPYAASKHALLGLTRCLAQEGYVANCVCPAYIDTEALSDEEREQFAWESPRERLLSIEEVAFAVLFALVAPMNGQALVLDAGGTEFFQGPLVG